MAFDFEKNIAIWEKLGFYPFTRACLNDAKVRHEVVAKHDGIINLTQHTMVAKLLAIEDLNRAVCSILSNYDFKGGVF